MFLGEKTISIVSSDNKNYILLLSIFHLLLCSLLKKSVYGLWIILNQEKNSLCTNSFI